MTSDTTADILIIGAGPGGYVAAIRAAQLGFRVVCVEQKETLGGTCLNEGCIPSKALLHSSHLYEEARLHFQDHGIHFAAVTLDLPRMMARKNALVHELTKGIEFLFKKNKITHVKGTAKLLSSQQIQVETATGSHVWTAQKAIILATGSVPVFLPETTVDETAIVSSTGALILNTVPQTMMIVGGGYIGLEMGSVWRRLGAHVTVVEFLDRIVPLMDRETGNQLHKILEKQGLVFKLLTKVEAVVKEKKGVRVTLASGPDFSQKEEAYIDVLLLSLGRKPRVEGLGLEAVGIQVDDRGCVPVNTHFETVCPGIYAIGDLIPGPMLAHKAEEEGIAVAEILAGQAGHVNYAVIPSVIYTHPEVASVGLSEEEAKNQGIPYRTGKFSFLANARAKANGHTEGWVKILADPQTDRVLGVHIVGPDAGTLIAEAALAMEFGASAEDIARTCHAHPTLNEAVKEAALAVDGRALHA